MKSRLNVPIPLIDILRHYADTAIQERDRYAVSIGMSANVLGDPGDLIVSFTPGSGKLFTDDGGATYEIDTPLRNRQGSVA